MIFLVLYRATPGLSSLLLNPKLVHVYDTCVPIDALVETTLLNNLIIRYTLNSLKARTVLNFGIVTFPCSQHMTIMLHSETLEYYFRMEPCPKEILLYTKQ